MFAASSSGTTRAPFLIDMAGDLGVSMPLVANIVSLTAVAWGITSAFAGWASDIVGRRPVLIGGLLSLAVAMAVQAMAGSFLWVSVWATMGGGSAGCFTGVIFSEVSGRVPDNERGRALGWIMSGQSLTLLIGVPMAAAGLGAAVIGWVGFEGFGPLAALLAFVGAAGALFARRRTV